MIKVVFVCLGNICRSPMAEGFFRKEVWEANLADQFEIDSAATGTWNLGNPPHRGTQKVLEKHQIDFSHMRARKISLADFETADYIIGMDESNVEDIYALGGTNSSALIYKLMDFVPNCDRSSIPDPYYTGDFDETERLVSAGTKGLLQTIREKHHL